MSTDVRADVRADRICAAWGPLSAEHGEHEHMSCSVVYWSAEETTRLGQRDGPFPLVCGCECLTCKRAWWKAGRPRVVDDTPAIGAVRMIEYDNGTTLAARWAQRGAR